MNQSNNEVAQLESHLGFWLRFVSNHVSIRFESLLAAHDISVSEWVALRAFYHRQDVGHAYLIDVLGMTKGAASKVIAKLEAKNLLTKAKVNGSLKEQVIRLTETATQLVPKLAALAGDNESHFFAHLSDQQRQDLLNLMQDLAAYHHFKKFPTQ